MAYVNVKIDGGDLLNMLDNRVEDWTQDETTRKLFHAMYENYVYGGCFDGMELDINVIVDNDYVNYCSVVEEGEDDYNDILKVYEAQGLGDCSCEDCNANYIEAVTDDKKAFLIRW